MKARKFAKKVFSKVINNITKWRYQLTNSISIGKSPTFEGKMEIKIDSDSAIVIGNHLHMRGPFYVKALTGGRLEIGDSCFFNHNCSITCMRSIKIGENCKFGNNLVIVDHDHNFKHKNEGEYLSEPIKIGNNIWIGANVTILKGVSIGDNCVIAAGSIVRKSIPSNTILYQERKDILVKYDL